MNDRVATFLPTHLPVLGAAASRRYTKVIGVNQDPCITSSDASGFIFTIPGAAPGREQYGLAPSVTTVVVISPDNKTILNTYQKQKKSTAVLWSIRQSQSQGRLAMMPFSQDLKRTPLNEQKVKNQTTIERASLKTPVDTRKSTPSTQKYICLKTSNCISFSLQQYYQRLTQRQDDH